MGAPGGVGKPTNLQIVGALGDPKVKKDVDYGKLGGVKVTLNIDGQEHTYSLSKLTKIVDSVSKSITTRMDELPQAQKEIETLSKIKLGLSGRIKHITGRTARKADSAAAPLLAPSSAPPPPTLLALAQGKAFYPQAKPEDDSAMFTNHNEEGSWLMRPSSTQEGKVTIVVLQKPGNQPPIIKYSVDNNPDAIANKLEELQLDAELALIPEPVINSPAAPISKKEQQSLDKIHQALNKSGDSPHLGALDRSIFDYIPGLAHVDETALDEKQKKRLSELKQMAAFAATLQADQFKKGVIDEIVGYRLAMKSEGVTDAIPSTVHLHPQARERCEANGQFTKNDLFVHGEERDMGVLNDGQGGLFGAVPYRKGLRAKEPRQALTEFMQRHGGNYQIITSWKVDQRNSSWSPLSQAVKYQVTKYRKVGRGNYYWQTGRLKAFIHHRRATSELRKGFECKATHKQIDQTLRMQLAFQSEFFSKADMPGVDKEKGTVRIYRTENKNVLTANDIVDPGTNPCTMKRGPAESGSLFAPISAFTTNQKTKEGATGAAVTFQEVPFHRVLDTFMMGDMEDHEMEAVFLTDDLPFQYVGDIGAEAVKEHVRRGLTV